MTREDEDYYEDYFEMFTLIGWEQFLEEIKKSKELFSIEGIEGEKNLYYVQGQLAVFNNILSFEDKIRGQYDHIQSDEVEDVE